MVSMGSTQPTVDIICAVYNGGDSLCATIESILGQTYSSFQLIIIDDCSSDDSTGRLIRHYQEIDTRIVGIANKVNRGLTLSLREGVINSKAKYIARIDAGDIWKPHKLQRQVEALERDDGLFIIGTQCVYIDVHNSILGHSKFPVSNVDIRRAINKRRSVFSHPTVVFRNSINYRGVFQYSQDLDLYLRCLNLGRLENLREELTCVLINRGGLTLRNKPIQRRYINAAFTCYFQSLQPESLPDSFFRVGRLERRLWDITLPFYNAFVSFRLRRCTFRAYFYLLLSCFLYPPLLLDYIRKLVPSKGKRIPRNA